MDTDQGYTPQQAVSYWLKHSNNIDLGELLKNMAVHEPAVFADFIAEVAGTTQTKLAGKLAKSYPDTFMRRATFENRYFEAARFVVQELRPRNPLGSKIQAIKKIREAWGLGLKEAKDIADTVQFELEKMDQPGSSYVPRAMTTFSVEMNNAYLKIMEAAT